MANVIRGPLETTTILYEDLSDDGIIDAWKSEPDGAGVRFLALARSPNPLNNNITVIDVFRSQPGVNAFAHNPDKSFAFQHKIDHVKGTPDGHDLIVYSDTHSTVPGAHADYVEEWRWVGVWTPLAAGGAQVQETCVPPLNRPNFRPNNTLTRGQMCKALAIAAKLPLPQDDRQTFEDVPLGSTFYPYVEAVHEAGAINGYTCKP